MVIIDETTQFENLVAMRDIVKALERKFTDHNGPFAYGTRLAEESGELIEALHENKDGIATDEQKRHLLKELEDILRVTTGILGIYNLQTAFPHSLDECVSGTDPHDIATYIAYIGIRSGELASTINHAEGTGIKKEKHGDNAQNRMLVTARALVEVIAWIITYFDIAPDIDAHIAESYLRYKAQGLID